MSQFIETLTEDVFNVYVLGWAMETNTDVHWPERIPVPEYSRDLNVALALLGDLPLNLASAPTVKWDGKYIWRAEIPFKPESFVAYHDSPARAVCLAWLAYREAEKVK